MVERLHRHYKTKPFFAQKVRFRYFAIGKDNFSCGRTPDAELILFLAEGHSGGALLHNKSARAARAFCFIGHGYNRVNLGFSAIRDPLLGAVKYVMVAVLFRRGLYPSGIRTRLSLGYTERRQFFAGGYIGKVLRLLLIVGVKQYRVCPEARSGKSQGYTAAAPRKILGSDGHFENAAAHSAVLFGNVNAADVRFGQDLHYVPWKFVLLIIFGGNGLYLLFRYLAAEVPYHLLFFG